MSSITSEVKEVSGSIIVQPLEGKWKASVFHLPPHPKGKLKKGDLVQITVPLGGQGAEWASVD